MPQSQTEPKPASQTPYEMMGGAEGVRRLAERFYVIMSECPEARPIRMMHKDELAPMTGKLAGFLSGWLGGPRDYFESPDAPCIMSVHHAFPIGEAERDQWLMCMSRALREVGANEEVRALLEPAFARVANAMRSR